MSALLPGRFQSLVFFGQNQERGEVGLFSEKLSTTNFEESWKENQAMWLCDARLFFFFITQFKLGVNLVPGFSPFRKEAQSVRVLVATSANEYSCELQRLDF